jgi:hypothetical protein
VLDAPSQQALVALQGVSGNCLEAVKAASASLSSAQKASLEDADIDVVDAGDERGEAKVALADAVAAVVGTGEGVISLTRTQGHWEITLGIPPG